MSQFTRINRGSGRRRDAMLRSMYGLTIPHGNGPRVGLCFSRSGLSAEQHRARMQASMARADEFVRRGHGR